MRSFMFSALLVAIGHLGSTTQTRPEPDLEALPFAPRQFVCYRPSGSLTIDGRLDEPSWKAAAWTDPFVDILGDRAPRPRFATRAKMLWDDDYFYFAADIEEPHLWATLTARDSVIFQDNDFEIFIDPDGDTHNYFELEINAFATVWDLMLVQPYRDGGPAIHAWDIAGLKAAVDARGTINRPDDRDDGWSVEIAIPWRIIDEAAPGRRKPRAGDRWRVNFSRVQWQLDVADNRYAKRRDPAGGKPLPEDNWVWSPQGAVNMHMPERWGIVQFADAASRHADRRVRGGSERSRGLGAPPPLLSPAPAVVVGGPLRPQPRRPRRRRDRDCGPRVQAVDARDGHDVRNQRSGIRRSRRSHPPRRQGLADEVSQLAAGKSIEAADRS